jgi:hypothetical protein
MTDYYSVIARALSGLLSNTDEARREIYDRARTALQERLRTLDPPISEAALANEQDALEAAIRNVEAELLFGDIRRIAREEAAASTPSLSFISRLKGFARSVGAKFNNRDRWSPALDHLKTLFLENTKDAKRLLNSVIRR